MSPAGRSTARGHDRDERDAPPIAVRVNASRLLGCGQGGVAVAESISGSSRLSATALRRHRLRRGPGPPAVRCRRPVDERVERGVVGRGSGCRGRRAGRGTPRCPGTRRRHRARSGGRRAGRARRLRPGRCSAAASSRTGSHVTSTAAANRARAASYGLGGRRPRRVQVGLARRLDEEVAEPLDVHVGRRGHRLQGQPLRRRIDVEQRRPDRSSQSSTTASQRVGHARPAPGRWRARPRCARRRGSCRPAACVGHASPWRRGGRAATAIASHRRVGRGAARRPRRATPAARSARTPGPRRPWRSPDRSAAASGRATRPARRARRRAARPTTASSGRSSSGADDRGLVERRAALLVGEVRAVALEVHAQRLDGGEQALVDPDAERRRGDPSDPFEVGPQPDLQSTSRRASSSHSRNGRSSLGRPRPSRSRMPVPPVAVEQGVLEDGRVLVAGRAVDGPRPWQRLAGGEDLLDDEPAVADRVAQPVEVVLRIDQPVDVVDADAGERRRAQPACCGTVSTTAATSGSTTRRPTRSSIVKNRRTLRAGSRHHCRR